MWYLVAPPTGTNVPIVVTLAGLAAVNQGVVVGATTFTGVDQILPIRASASADGAASPSNVPVTSAASDMVVDTLAMARNVNATVAAGNPKVESSVRGDDRLGYQRSWLHRSWGRAHGHNVRDSQRRDELVKGCRFHKVRRSSHSSRY